MLGLVKEHQPVEKLVSHNELIGILDNRSSGFSEIDWESQQNKQSNKRRAMIFISTIIIAGLGAGLFWGKPEVNHEGLAGVTTPAYTLISEEEPSNHLESIITLDEQVLRTLPEDVKLEIDRDDEVEEQSDVRGYHITGLTDEELRKLGLFYKEDKVKYEEEIILSTKELQPSRLRGLKKLGYDITQDNLTFRLTTTLGFSPNMGVRSSPMGPSSERVSLVPIASTIITENREGVISIPGDEQLGWLNIGERELFKRELSALTDKYSTFSSTDAGSLSVLDKLAAVHIPYEYRNNEGEMKREDLYIWYVPSVELLEALPERYHTQELIERVEYVLKAPKNNLGRTNPKDLIPGVYVIKHSSGYPELYEYDRERDIQGINILDLTQEELEKIDINFQDEGMVFAMEQLMPPAEPVLALGYESEEAWIPVRFKMVVDTFEVNFNTVRAEDAHTSVHAPVLISSRWIKSGDERTKGSGLYMLFSTDAPTLNAMGEAGVELLEEVEQLYRFGDNADMTKEELMAKLTSLNKLIPVRVRMTSDEYVEEAGKNHGTEALLWYVPTPGFVDALPERYREPLKRELDAIASVEAEGLPSHEVCERTAGEPTFLDVCRSSGGAVAGTTIWPNPVKPGGDVTIRYRLTEPREVMISLHDLSGRFLQELSSEGTKDMGNHASNLSLDGVNSGAYLVALRTDQGETAIQRVIVGE